MPVAEELTSRTFFTALRGIGTLRRGTDPPKVWLLQLAARILVDHARELPHRQAPAGDVPDGDPDPEAQVKNQEERTRRTIMVRGLLAHLPTDQRRCIVLRHVLGLSVEEVSRRMNRSPKAIAALTCRAVHNLRIRAGLPVDPLP